MDLLSPKIRKQIYGAKGALLNLRDTFYKTPVLYHAARAGGFDTAFEGGGLTYTDYELAMCRVIANSNLSNRFTQQGAGMADGRDITVSIFTVDLIALGLWDTVLEYINTRVTEDYFTVQGGRYRVISVTGEGYFDERPVLVQIAGKKQLQTN